MKRSSSVGDIKYDAKKQNNTSLSFKNEPISNIKMAKLQRSQSSDSTTIDEIKEQFRTDVMLNG